LSTSGQRDLRKAVFFAETFRPFVSVASKRVVTVFNNLYFQAH